MRRRRQDRIKQEKQRDVTTGRERANRVRNGKEKRKGNERMNGKREQRK